MSVPIKFRTATATHVKKVGRAYLEEIIAENGAALYEAIGWCADHGIGAFRINSQFLPVASHPELGYRLADVGVDLSLSCNLARDRGVRLSFHPDQFVVLNSPRPEVVEAAIRDLEIHAELAEAVGADVVNIHGGGAYGDKKAALDRFCRHFERLSPKVQKVLTVENDDVTFTPEDLLPVCRRLGIPLCYDVHHHRCLPDGLSIEAATEAALKTWKREPLFHISSPLGGWKAKDPRRHADCIDVRDFPDAWKRLKKCTIDVEAKDKERAVLKLQTELQAIHLM